MMFDLGPSGALSKVAYSGDGTENGLYLLNIILCLSFVLNWVILLERFSYDPEQKTRKQNKNNKRTEREQFDQLMGRIQTRVAFGWLSERSGEKTLCPRTFQKSTLTSYCKTISQSNNALSILGFSLAGKRRVHVFTFSSNGRKNK